MFSPPTFRTIKNQLGPTCKDDVAGSVTGSQSVAVQDTSGCGAQRITTCSTSPWRTSWWPPSTASSHSSSWGTGQQLSSFFDYLPQFHSMIYPLLYPWNVPADLLLQLFWDKKGDFVPKPLFSIPNTKQQASLTLGQEWYIVATSTVYLYLVFRREQNVPSWYVVHLYFEVHQK